MSPGVAHTQEYMVKCDVYSFSILVYEILSLQSTFGNYQHSGQLLLCQETLAMIVRLCRLDYWKKVLGLSQQSHLGTLQSLVLLGVAQHFPVVAPLPEPAAAKTCLTTGIPCEVSGVPDV
jgi:hypothetical protein